jgi:hypothetical protein
LELPRQVPGGDEAASYVYAHVKNNAVQSCQSPSERIRPVYVTACHFFLSWWLETASVSVLPS